MFALTVFEILLFEGKSVLSPAQRETGSEGVKVSVKNQKNIWNLLEMLEKWLTYKLRKFWMVFKFFWFCLTLSVPEKLKNSIFEMPINPQTLNINNLRTTNGNSINLHTIRKLVEHSLKMFCQGNVYSCVFEIWLSEHRWVLSPAQRGTGNERVKYGFTFFWCIYIYIYIKKPTLLYVTTANSKKSHIFPYRYISELYSFVCPHQPNVFHQPNCIPSYSPTNCMAPPTKFLIE